MNLYYAVTNYHLLCCILHAIKYHAKEDNILYLSCWHPDNEILIKQLKKTNVFSRVELFQEVAFPSGNKKISNKQMEIDIKKIIECIPKKFIEDVSKSTEINIAGDHYCVSVYLEKNKIIYNYLEEACGVLSDEERLMKIIRNIDYSRYQIMKKLKLPGNHSFIKTRYGDLNHQLDGYSNNKDVHFSVPDILGTLSKKQLKDIVKVFSEEEFEIPKSSTLLLTFHYVNMNLLDLESQRYLYSILLDYFFKGNKVVIKQHPSDVQPDYHKWFPRALILPRKMPSELLPFLSENKFTRALTSYSTSIFSLKSYCNDVVSFGMYIEKQFKLIHKYYFILNMLKEISNKEDYKIIGLGLDDSIVKNILKEYDINNLNINLVSNISDINKEKKKIIVIDEYELDESVLEIIDSNNVIFWINEVKFMEFSFKYLNNKFDNFSSILLIKEVIDSSKCVGSDLTDEIIPYYCCNAEFFSQFYRFKFEKKLENCNMNIKLELNEIKGILKFQEEIKQLYIDKNSLEETIEKTNNELNRKNEEFRINLEQSNLKINELIEENQKYKNLYDEVINSSSWKITSIYRKVGRIIKKIIRRG